MEVLERGSPACIKRVKGDIEKFHNGERSRFHGIVHAAFLNNIVTPESLASKLNCNVVDARKCAKARHSVPRNKQTEIVDFIQHHIS